METYLLVKLHAVNSVLMALQVDSGSMTLGPSSLQSFSRFPHSLPMLIRLVQSKAQTANLAGRKSRL